jgi:hypothetical protein
MMGPAERHPRFPPRARFSYWPFSAAVMVFWLWLLWVFGAVEWLRFDTEALRVFLSIMLYTSILPILAWLALIVPIYRDGYVLTPEGIEICPAGRPDRFRTIPWAAIDKLILRQRMKGPGFLEIGLRPEARVMFGRRVEVTANRTSWSPLDMLIAIRTVAPEAGFELKGHRLDIRHMGGEEWRLVPIPTADAAPALVETSQRP